jgi:hypothetical protein
MQSSCHAIQPGVCTVRRGPPAGRRHACELCLCWPKLVDLGLEQTLRCAFQLRDGFCRVLSHVLVLCLVIWLAHGCVQFTCKSLLILLHEGHHGIPSRRLRTWLLVVVTLQLVRNSAGVPSAGNLHEKPSAKTLPDSHQTFKDQPG